MCKENWSPSMSDFSPETQAKITNEAREFQSELIQWLSNRGESKVRLELPKDFGKGGYEKGKIYTLDAPAGTGKSEILKRMRERISPLSRFETFLLMEYLNLTYPPAGIDIHDDKQLESHYDNANKWVSEVVSKLKDLGLLNLKSDEQ